MKSLKRIPETNLGGFLGQDVSCKLPREQPCYGGRSCDIGRLHRVLEVRNLQGKANPWI